MKRFLWYPLFALWTIYVATPMRLLGLNGDSAPGAVSYTVWRLRHH